MIDAFEAGPPRGWTPSAGEDVLLYVGCGPTGPVVTTERVASTFRKSHWSGNTTTHFVLECGIVCGMNSIRPREANP